MNTEASIGIIGGADEVTAIFITGSLWPLLGLLLAALVAYLLGSVDFGVVISKLVYKDDVRKRGSGGAGATNMLRTYGKAAGALTLGGDLGKGVVAVLLGQLLLGFFAPMQVAMPGENAGVLDFMQLLTAAPKLGIYGGYVAAIAALCGHLWPVWFRFKGGKGVAVAAGALLATEPVVFLALAVIFFTMFAINRMVSLCSITVAGLYPVLTALWSWYTGRDVWFTTLCAALMGGLVIWMHRANIQRIRAGTEYRFGSKGNKDKP